MWWWWMLRLFVCSVNSTSAIDNHFCWDWKLNDSSVVRSVPWVSSLLSGCLYCQRSSDNTSDHILRKQWETSRGHYNALCCYPHVKVSIRELNQISTTAPIFQQYNYFRQNSEENVTFTFYFFSFASNFPCKILETVKILMQIFVYFKFHFDNDECPW